MINFSRLRSFLDENTSKSILIGSAFISIAILLFLFLGANYQQLTGSLGKVSLKWFMLMLAIFILLLLIVTFRLVFALQLKSTKEFYECFDVCIIHVILLTILPARLGDLCYPFILRQNLSLDIASGFSNLFIIRLYDLLTVASLLLVSVLYTSSELYFHLNITYVIIILVLGILTIFLGLHQIKTGDSNSESNKQTITGRLSDFLKKIHKAYLDISLKTHGLILIMTLLRWLLATLLFFLIFTALKIEISPVQAILVTTGLNLAVLIPVQTMGGFGITEAVLAWFLNLFGYPVEMAISIALSSRLVWITLPFATGFIWFSIRKNLFN